MGPPRPYCGNNALARELRENGGDAEFGRPSQCSRRGFTQGLKQDITDMEGYLEKWGGAYKPHVEQFLYYGYVARATLPQAVTCGFAVGSRARAELERKRHKSGDTRRGRKERRRHSPGSPQPRKHSLGTTEIFKSPRPSAASDQSCVSSA